MMGLYSNPTPLDPVDSPSVPEVETPVPVAAPVVLPVAVGDSVTWCGIGPLKVIEINGTFYTAWSPTLRVQVSDVAELVRM